MIHANDYNEANIVSKRLLINDANMFVNITVYVNKLYCLKMPTMFVNLYWLGGHNCTALCSIPWDGEGLHSGWTQLCIVNFYWLEGHNCTTSSPMPWDG